MAESLQVTAECGNPVTDPNDDDDLDELDSLRGRRKRQDYYQPINPVPVPQDQSRVLQIPADAILGLDPLSYAFSEELQCLDIFERVIGTMPEHMCYLDKYKVSSSSNVNCWAGTHLVAKERFVKWILLQYYNDLCKLEIVKSDAFLSGFI